MTEAITRYEQLTPEIREWLLAELRSPVMATIRSDGFPSQSVVWFDVADEPDTILLNTLAGRMKDRHLRRDPRMSLCFEEGLDYVTLEGRAEVVDDPERALADIKALARRYGGRESFYDGQHRIRILFRVEKVIHHQ